MKRKQFGKRAVGLLLAGVMTVGLAACGQDKAKTEQTGTDSTYVYVPEWNTLSSGEGGWQSDFSIQGSRLYYHQYEQEQNSEVLKYLDLTNLSAAPVDVYRVTSQNEPDAEGYSSNISNVYPAQNDELVLISRKYPAQKDGEEYDYEAVQRNTIYTMSKLAADGSVVFEQDITETLNRTDQTYISYGMTDADGNIYLSNGYSSVWIFDKDGNLLSYVALDTNDYGGIGGIGFIGDGRLAITQYGMDGSSIKVYNEEKKAFSDVYTGLPDNCYNSGIAKGPNGGVLLNSSGGLYEYDLATQTYTQILKWIDCDLNGDYVNAVTALEDGTVAVLYRDWVTDETSVVCLKKTAASEVVQKQTLTYACMGISQSMQNAVVNFNKTSEEYRIVIKDYNDNMDYSRDDILEQYKDVLNQFLNDIVSGNVPDLIDPSSLDINMLAAKGILADLNPYLDASTVLNRSDLIEPVLNAYTTDGNLYMIPVRFNISTLAGRTSEVGEKSGWTMEDMVALAERYPEAELFSGSTRESFLSQCLSYDFDSYVNWKTGECSFDSPEFKSILTLAAKYPAELDWENVPSEPAALRTHEALLSELSLSEPEGWQVAEKMFDEPITAIGFPSANSTGVMVSGTNGVCISASSAHKEAAWSFIEQQFIASKVEDDWMSWGFATLKEVYDKEMKKAMTPQYQIGADGNYVLDENGNKVEYSSSSYGWGDDIMIEVYAVTQEEADSIWNVIEQIGGVAAYNEELLNIVTEEAAPFFEGQKTVDEVADIIQSRIKIYVNESR